MNSMTMKAKKPPKVVIETGSQSKRNVGASQGLAACIGMEASRCVMLPIDRTGAWHEGKAVFYIHLTQPTILDALI